MSAALLVLLPALVACGGTKAPPAAAADVAPAAPAEPTGNFPTDSKSKAFVKGLTARDITDFAAVNGNSASVTVQPPVLLGRQHLVRRGILRDRRGTHGLHRGGHLEHGPSRVRHCRDHFVGCRQDRLRLTHHRDRGAGKGHTDRQRHRRRLALSGPWANGQSAYRRAGQAWSMAAWAARKPSRAALMIPPA